VVLPDCLGPVIFTTRYFVKIEEEYSASILGKIYTIGYQYAIV
jgi:hypothetical protein